MGLRPGTSATAYIQAVNARLGSSSPWGATGPEGGQFYQIASALIGLLALMVAVAAGLGVLNTVLMTTRDRVHDLGIFKALGMRPGQLLTMVVCWIAGPAVIAAVIAAPAAVALNAATVRAMAGTAHTGIPASFTQVFPPPGSRCCPWPRSPSRPPGRCCRRAGRPGPARPPRCAPSDGAAVKRHLPRPPVP